MNTTFYTVWLPISVIAHLGLVIIFSAAIKMAPPITEGGKEYQVTLLNKFVPNPPVLTPETESEEIKLNTTHQPQTNKTDTVAAKKGTPTAPNTDSKQNSGAGPQDPAIKKTGASGPGTSPDQGAAPKMTTGTNAVRVPQDEVGGRGYGGGDPKDIPGGGQGGGLVNGRAEATRLRNPSIPKDSANTIKKGTVVISLNIGADGKISGTPVFLQSSGNSGVDNAAMAAAKASSFKSKVVNGTAIASRAKITYNFENGALVGSPVFTEES